MAVKIQNFPKKNFGQPEFTLSCPSGWNSNEQRTQRALCKNISFSLEPAHQLCYKAKHLGLQIPDQKSSPTLSIGQSQNEVGAVGGTKSQDQCISSESGHDQSCGKGMKSNMKPFFLLSSADVALATSHADSSHSVASAPYPCADPYFHGMLGPYGPQAIIQPQLAPQMARMTATRVPLPFSIADEGPIYVNAKQYHGILRRRQSRAKLEAQNKLFKTRKPYLHESRHRHALNRVRGTGGRFLGTKKLQQCNPGPTTNVDSVSETIYVHQRNTKFERETSCSGTGQSGASNTNTSCSDLIGVSNSDVIIRPPDSLFSGISVPVGRRM